MPDPAQVAASLSQLEGALESYLALGSDTPLSGQAKSWLDDVRAEREAIKSEGSEEQPPESELEDSSPSDFRGARKAAGEAMRDGTLGEGRGGTKTPPEEEQSPDDEDQAKKKRSKAY